MRPLLGRRIDEPELPASRRLLGTLSNSIGDEYLTVKRNGRTSTLPSTRPASSISASKSSGSLWVSEFYGFTLDAVEHELVLKARAYPQAMQNVAATMSINVHNYGMAGERRTPPTLTAIVNGEEMAVASTVDIPVNLSLNDAATSIPMAVRYHTPGTYPVQLRLATATCSSPARPKR